MAESNLDKFRRLLAELFMFDHADLDFGIYRIMNAKRDEITRFLDNDLLPQVRQTLAQVGESDRGVIETELAKAIEAAKELGVDPETSTKVKELRQQLAGTIDIVKLENEVFSNLFDFFRRYYSEGDFLSLRRYKPGVYAIPYEGEEVHLHWANKDQYYIKTSEYFRDYAFKVPDGRRVHFKIVSADTEKDNVKAAPEKDRRFLLTTENTVIEENGELIIRFEYKPDEQRRKQAAINEAVVAAIITVAPQTWQAALAAKAPTETNPDRTILEKHLTDYSARNTFDYFIHKDLSGFLRRELDFYIKNEIMHLDDIENESSPKAEQYLVKVKAIRKIAHKIIDFLAQLENFQKKLWLKKKFVVETNYCITLDRIPEEFYSEIAANDAQRDEWVKLFAIDEIKGDLTIPAYSVPLKSEFLRSNPSLVIDTCHFGIGFTEKLLSALNDFDGQLGGLLIHADNFQALQLLQHRYGDQLACVHIDPPYNTETSGFQYKNDYRHSSWLTMMDNRIWAQARLFNSDGSFICHIDENEYEHLHLLLEQFPMPNAGTIAWDKRNPMNAGRGIATQHEYIVWRSFRETPLYLRNENIIEMLKVARKIVSKYKGVTEMAQKEYATWIDENENLTGGEKAYRHLDNKGRVYQSVSLRAPEPRTDPKFHKPLIHPITGKPCPVPPNGFSRTPETLQTMMEKEEILFGKDENTQPRQKVILKEGTRRQVSSVIQEARKGKADLDLLGLDFAYCHPVSLYLELVAAATKPKNDIVLDYFAGSGTTGHAVINLNREDGGDRRYILVEMGAYFDTVLVPRIKKVVYSQDWKEAKPISRNGISHFFKYIRLESYEDSLNNLVLQSPEQKHLFEQEPGLREDYTLHYMLDTETDGSASLLNISSFDNPFSYKLKISTGSVGETKDINVDLIETFNYLIGLRVKHIDLIRGFRVIQGTNPAGEKVLVIWRNVKEKPNDALDEFFLKQGYNTRDMEFDLIYVNGDNNLENLKRPDDTWKVRLIEEDFLRLMFDVKDV